MKLDAIAQTFPVERERAAFASAPETRAPLDFMTKSMAAYVRQALVT
jgi:hypothetical protein